MKNAALTKTAYSMLCALCVALSAAVQLVFPGFGTGRALAFSVFLCAVCCPLRYGVFCALLCPVVAMMTAASPSAALLPGNMAECLVFVLLLRLLFGWVHTGRLLTDLYISLVPAVSLGKIVGAVISAAIFCGDGNSMLLFVLHSLIAAVPEITVLLALTPGAVKLLKSLGLTEEKQPIKNNTENSV